MTVALGGVCSGGDAQGDAIAADVENLRGSAHADVLTGNAADNELQGAGGDDVLQGSGGNDRLLGGDGENILGGDSGDDRLLGGAGADVMNGGDGFDTVDYSGSIQGVVVTLGGAASGGDADNDTIADDVESVVGTANTDALTGNAAANELWGRDGNDVLDGDGGDDRLYGGVGDDVIRGGGGDDWLYGGEDRPLFTDWGELIFTGVDSFFGGDGIDIVSYRSDGPDSRAGEGLRATIGSTNSYGEFIADDIEGLEGTTVADSLTRQ